MRKPSQAKLTFAEIKEVHLFVEVDDSLQLVDWIALFVGVAPELFDRLAERHFSSGLASVVSDYQLHPELQVHQVQQDRSHKQQDLCFPIPVVDDVQKEEVAALGDARLPCRPSGRNRKISASSGRYGSCSRLALCKAEAKSTCLSNSTPSCNSC